MSEDRYDPRNGPRDRSLRVGDKERDAVAAILQQRHVEGRLDADEFQTRLERCMTAKTYRELDALIADFPREEERGRRATEDTRWNARPWPRPVLLLPLALIAAFVVGAHAAWLVVPLLFFFVVRPLVWGTSGCGPRRTSKYFRAL
jgi:DUF1707 SHOCT-like domain